MTEIILQKNGAGKEGLQFDLLIKNVPENFLGLAADINFEGDLAAADFRGMEWGEVFQSLSDKDKPIELIKVLPEQQKVVLGITFKATGLPRLQDGKMATLVFEKDGIIPKSFENRVLSVFENGRRDLSDTVWTVEGQPALKTGSLSDSNSSTGQSRAGQHILPIIGGTHSIPTATESAINVTDAALLEALNAPATSPADSLWSWWWLMLILLAMLPGLLLVLALANRKNRSGSDTALGAFLKQIKLDY